MDQARIVSLELARRELFLPVRRDRYGLAGPTPWAARGPHWRASSRGHYVPARVERTTDQRILEAAVLLPDHGGVTGWASLRWRRARWFDGVGPTDLERPVPLVTAGSHIRAQRGVLVSKERLDPRDLVVVDGIRTTSEVRSVWFEMRYARDETEAAIVLSMAAYDDLVSLDELADYAWLHPGWTGAPRCRGGLALAVENAWSPQEVRVHAVWQLDAELPRLRCNEPIFDRRGAHLVTPDLLDVEAGLAIEYDGPTHLPVSARATDVRRDEIYRRHDIEVIRVLGPHLADRWSLVARMQQARRRARFEAESTRTWTVEPPGWWTPTHTVELRRRLSETDRERLLGHRHAA
jgi:hypothetical protein